MGPGCSQQQSITVQIRKKKGRIQVWALYTFQEKQWRSILRSIVLLALGDSLSNDCENQTRLMPGHCRI